MVRCWARYIFSHLEIVCAVFFLKGWFVAWPHAFFTLYGLNLGNSVGTTYLPSYVSKGEIPLPKFTNLCYEQSSMHTRQTNRRPSPGVSRTCSIPLLIPMVMSSSSFTSSMLASSLWNRKAGGEGLPLPPVSRVG